MVSECSYLSFFTIDPYNESFVVHCHDFLLTNKRFVAKKSRLWFIIGNPIDGYFTKSVIKVRKVCLFDLFLLPPK